MRKAVGTQRALQLVGRLSANIAASKKIPALLSLCTCAVAILASPYPASCADSSKNSDLQAAPEMLLGNQEVSRVINDGNGEKLAFDVGNRVRGRSEPASLDIVRVRTSSDGRLQLSHYPKFGNLLGGRYANITPQNNVVFYTIDPDLQNYVSSVVSNARADHVAIVAMNPRTGAILAIAGKSPTIPDVEYHAGFPAASLFKVVTAAAAVEEAGINPNSLVAFRGGTYTLNQYNYLPNPRADRRVMSVGEALGRSCNPVFGHIGIKYLDGSILARYAQKFGFNSSIGFEAPLPSSHAEVPDGDLFELSRTAAGFGEVRLSPIHAAAITAGIANGGLLPKPRLIDRIVTVDGVTVEQSRPEIVQRIIQPQTAATLMEMMRYTTTIGTSRREFNRGGQPALGNIEVAGKTGTLSGSNPPGLNNWFIGAAPINNPEVVVSVITVDPAHSSKASRLGRLVMQRFFNIEPGPELPEPTVRQKKSRFSKYNRSGKHAYHRPKKSTTAKKVAPKRSLSRKGSKKK